jgi:SPRY domain-containing SOCS box protein 3
MSFDLNCYSNNQKQKNEQLSKSKQLPFKKYRLINWKWSKQSEAQLEEQQEEPSLYPISNHNEKTLQTPTTLISNDGKAVCFHPYNSFHSTQAVRGSHSLALNAYTYWEVSINSKQLSQGTSFQIGIGTQEAELYSVGYLNLLGKDVNSWGLSHKGYLYHNNESAHFCESFSRCDFSCSIESGDDNMTTIGCLFDGHNRCLYYFKDGHHLDKNCRPAFTDLPFNVDLFPMVSSTISQSVIRLEMSCENMPSLKDICRREITKSQFKFNYNNSNGTIIPKDLVLFLNKNDKF